ncbi:hypothetical protein [Bacillus marasmi]|uniref:hypothetical protein n=1 Tax=Bacillus marasmi TaxID=1926279 RepID=UPI0011CB6F66|nr:hypothetical protein [Bacillus marasmi]
MYHQNEFGNHHGHLYYRDDEFRNVKSACHKYMNFHVIGTMANGQQIEGILEDMDDRNVTILVPETVEEDVMESPETRVYGGFGGGYGRRRFRRFRRRRFPYTVFVAPFIIPFPYFY